MWETWRTSWASLSELVCARHDGLCAVHFNRYNTRGWDHDEAEPPLGRHSSRFLVNDCERAKWRARWRTLSGPRASPDMSGGKASLFLSTRLPCWSTQYSSPRTTRPSVIVTLASFPIRAWTAALAPPSLEAAFNT
jgi:hypothetical protein